MNAQTEPRDERYDLVVIGSGLGGSGAAAMLARAGLNVLLVERHDGVGGYSRAFVRGPYVFDTAIHNTAQGGPGELYDAVLRYVGVRDLCSFIPLQTIYDAVFPDLKIRVPANLEALIDAHVEQFPHERDGLTRFFNLCYQMHLEIHQLSMSLSIGELDQAAVRFPVLFTYIRATLQQVLDEFLTDDRAKAVCAAAWPFVGQVPSRLAFFPYAQNLANQCEGNWCCQGSFQRLAEALAAGVERNGGDVVVGNGAAKILVEDGHVGGVVLEGGQQIQTSLVISNADALQTLDELVGDEHLPQPFLKRLHRLKPSLSAFVLFTATTLPIEQLDLGYETFHNETWDHEHALSDILAGKPGGVWLAAPTLVDPAVSPPGHHQIIISAIAAYDVGQPWDQERERYAEQLLARAGALVPGLADNLTCCESATPLTLERYTLNHHGAVYGWENLPLQVGTKRLAHTTPIEGLYLSGHWTQPGASSLRVFASGVQTAQMILMRQGAEVPSFQEANLPTVAPS